MAKDEAGPKKKADEHAGPDERRAQAIEWIAGALSACLVLAVIAALVHDALWKSGGYPELSIVVEGSFPAGDAYLVQFKALNLGDATAAAVEIEGEISTAGALVETSSVTLDYVPGNSEATGGLIFQADPAAHQLVVTAKGYQEP